MTFHVKVSVSIVCFLNPFGWPTLDLQRTDVGFFYKLKEHCISSLRYPRFNRLFARRFISF